MVIVKDLIKKIRSKGRVDAKSLLSCWRQTVRKRGFTQDGRILCRSGFKWLEDMKKKDEKENLEEMHEHKVAQMTKSPEGSAGLVHKNLNAHSMERRGADFGKRRGCEVAGSL